MVGQQPTVVTASSSTQQPQSQQQPLQHLHNQQQQPQQQSTLAPTPLEPCKHAVSVANNKNEREHLKFKTTTATN